MQIIWLLANEKTYFAQLKSGEHAGHVVGRLRGGQIIRTFFKTLQNKQTYSMYVFSDI